MKPELRERIVKFNKYVKEKGERASDLDVIIAEILNLPPGQLKKVLTEPVLEVFRKYGVEI